MIAAVWNRLWDMHDETKALVLFRPLSLLRRTLKENVHLLEAGNERDVDLADEMDEAPAEHNRRLKTTPDGVEEGDPREYTRRQKIGLFLGPLLFVIMLAIPTPAGISPIPAYSITSGRRGIFSAFICIPQPESITISIRWPSKPKPVMSVQACTG